MNFAAASAIRGVPVERDGGSIARSPAMSEALAAAQDVAATPATVLVLGESGTGKEVLARFIHRCSPAAVGPFVPVSCASLPAERLETALRCARGTLFFDEIGELGPGLQARLLRALQEHELGREVRVIASSSRDLPARVRSGELRADLYYRLNVFAIRVPPLRERLEDLPELAAQLVAESCARLGVSQPTLTAAAVSSLRAERFPGNVRELSNLLERALVRCRGPLLDACHLNPGPDPELPAAQPTSYPAGLPLDLCALERLAIEEALRREHGNRTHAARLLGIGLRTLRNKLRQWRAEGQPVPPAEQAS